jgi:hypothetical protein
MEETKKSKLNNKALWASIAAVAFAVAAGYGVDLQGALCPNTTTESTPSVVDAGGVTEGKTNHP